MTAQRVRVIDSHTGGEPTRVVIEGGPPLRGTMAEQLRQFRESHDAFRSAVVNEPRGSDVLVGALLTQPAEPGCTGGVIFFNNVGFLGMCGHGSIGVIATLAWLGRIKPGDHKLATPVGVVHTRLHADGRVSVRNVPSYRLRERVAVQVDGHGKIVGDIAWGGNWFFLVRDHGQNLELTNVETLTDYTWRVRKALERAGITGEGGHIIDHIELFAAAREAGNDSRNFVMCPGKAYDRSPCGTGLSAKLACLHADDELAPGETWRQESITGSVFEGSYELEDGKVIPTVTGEAWVNADSTLILDPRDPCQWGMPHGATDLSG
jgi:4-hydroxyproline epimerase